MSQQQLKIQSQSDLLQRTVEAVAIRYLRFGEEGWLKFMRDELHFVPDDCFVPIIKDLSGCHDTTTRSSHGVGKTAGAACCVITAMTLVPNLVCLQLSPTWNQVTEIFWNEVRKWWANSRVLPIMFEMAEKAPKFHSRISPETWYARGVASNKPGNIEGRHGQNFFLVTDETKAIPDSMIEAAQGALTGVGKGIKVWTGHFSTPSTPGGQFTRFYKTFTRDRGRWRCHHIPASASPRVSQGWVNRMIQDFGEDSQIVKARVHGDFPDISDNMLITLKEAEDFYDPARLLDGGAVSVGVDVARFGQDESVISIYKGSCMVGLRPFTKKDTAQTSTMVAAIAIEQAARIVVVDDIGIGGGVTDQVVEKLAGHPEISVIGLNVSFKTNEPNKFCKLGDEIWWYFAEAVKSKRTWAHVEDETLQGQMTSYEVQYPGNLIRVDWPQERRKRASDSKSPDRSDAAAMGWWGSTLITLAQLDKRSSQEDEDDYPRPMTRGLRDRNF
jgi:phage terminase large subunit